MRMKEDSKGSLMADLNLSTKVWLTEGYEMP